MDRDRGWQTVALTRAPFEHVPGEHTRNRPDGPRARGASRLTGAAAATTEVAHAVGPSACLPGSSMGRGATWPYRVMVRGSWSGHAVGLQKGGAWVARSCPTRCSPREAAGPPDRPPVSDLLVRPDVRLHARARL